MNRMCVLAGMAVGVLAGAASGDVINVGPGGSIQAAVDAAQDGDEIVVAPGTYFENIMVEGKDITLRSSGGSEATIVTALNPNNAVVRIEGGNTDVIVDGFTLTGGTHPNLGLMYINGSATVQVANCVFADSATMGVSVQGNSTVVVAGCVFSQLSGTGALWSADTMTIADCTFVNNTAVAGGALYFSNNATPIITGCVFAGNNATTSIGGAIYFSHGNDATVTNCVFIENEAILAGGAIYASESNPMISNCTFSGNIGLGGAIFSDEFSFPEIRNSILWDNFPFQIYDSDSLTTVIFCNIEDGWEAPGSFGVIDADPLFADAANGDYRLQAGSPCIDAGHNLGVLPDLVDLDGDGDTTEFTPLDLDGNARFADDLGTADTGCGVPGVVDMGAFEFTGDPFDVKLGDIDGDGIVGIVDFLALLGDWGSCIVDCCLADLDLDENVGIADFLLLLGNWG